LVLVEPTPIPDTPAPEMPQPFATNSGEEEMLEKEDETTLPLTPAPVLSLTVMPSIPLSRLTIGSQLKQKTPVQPPGAPKKAKSLQQPKPTWCLQRITQCVTKHNTGSKMPSSAAGTGKHSMPRGSSIFQGYHPDYIDPEGANEAMLLVQLEEQMDEDEDEFDPLNTFDSYEVIALAIQETQSNPKTLREAQSHMDWPQWEEAMDHEIATLEHTGTWTTALCPPGKNIVGSKWVFWTKHRANGSVKKARLVTRGFTQIFSKDYYDTFSPQSSLVFEPSLHWLHEITGKLNHSISTVLI
jgi:hypothetical protein